jgi:ABC-type transporter Mla subunit MlaD
MLSRISGRLGLDPRAGVGLVVLLAGVGIWALTFTGFIPKLMQSSTTTVKAEFASAQDIVSQDPVRIDGVQVGHVGRVTVNPGGRGVTVTLKLDKSAGHIYRDASAVVRWRTLLGANDAIALYRGTPREGLLGSRSIPQSQTSDQVELDQITSVLHGGAVTGMKTMLGQLAPAFSDHRAPAAAFGALAHAAPTITSGIGALRGVQTDADLRNLVAQAGRAARAVDIGQNAVYTQDVVQSAARTLAITGENAGNVRALLADANAAMPHVTKTAAAVDHTLDLLDPLVAKLTPIAPRLAPTLADLHPAVDGLNALLLDAPPLLNSLRPSVNSLAETARAGVPVIDQLAPALEQVDAHILPDLSKVSPESKHAVYQMIGPTLAGADSLAGGYDANGNFARLQGSGDSNSLDVAPCRANFSAPNQVLTCETLQQAFQQLLAPVKAGSRPQAPYRNLLAKQYPKIAARLFGGQGRKRSR